MTENLKPPAKFIEEIDCKGNDNYVCPYCGYENESGHEEGEINGEMECGDCEREFSWQVEYYPSCDTEKLEIALERKIRGLQGDIVHYEAHLAKSSMSNANYQFWIDESKKDIENLQTKLEQLAEDEKERALISSEEEPLEATDNAK